MTATSSNLAAKAGPQGAGNPVEDSQFAAILSGTQQGQPAKNSSDTNAGNNASGPAANAGSGNNPPSNNSPGNILSGNRIASNDVSDPSAQPGSTSGPGSQDGPLQAAGANGQNDKSTDDTSPAANDNATSPQTPLTNDLMAQLAMANMIVTQPPVQPPIPTNANSSGGNSPAPAPGANAGADTPATNSAAAPVPAPTGGSLPQTPALPTDSDNDDDSTGAADPTPQQDATASIPQPSAAPPTVPDLTVAAGTSGVPDTGEVTNNINVPRPTAPAGKSTSKDQDKKDASSDTSDSPGAASQASQNSQSSQPPVAGVLVSPPVMPPPIQIVNSPVNGKTSSDITVKDAKSVSDAAPAGSKLTDAKTPPPTDISSQIGDDGAVDQPAASATADTPAAAAAAHGDKAVFAKSGTSQTSDASGPPQQTPAPTPPPAPLPPATQSPSVLAANGVVPPPPAGSPPALTANIHVAPQDPAAAPNLNSLAVEIAAKSQSGTKQFDIRLDPPELGRVDVRLSIDPSGKVVAHMTADQPQTLDMLQKDSATLTRALRDAGLNVTQDGLNFSLKGQDRQSSGSSNNPQPRTPSLVLTATKTIDAIQSGASYFSNAGDARLDIHV